MPLTRLYAQCAIAMLAALTSGCGDKKTDHAEKPAAAEESAAPRAEAAQAPGNSVNAPLTVDDIARWEKGMAGELKAVQEAGAKMKGARTNEDSLNAMMGVQEMNTVAAGAQAAGLEQERYKFVRSNLSSVAGYMTPWLGGIDTTMLSPSQREEMRRDNEAQITRMQADVPAEVVDAMRPRAAELRTKSMELVGARLQGAGMR
jgi:hypothetical protein